ncbi:MAG: ABC transporter ATP-binding protein [Ruminococcaceae bacterium]|nr:ABC transporter ATP-binding protein [Oscillospiraceae bacterium]
MDRMSLTGKETFCNVLFGKHINKYYLRYAIPLIVGVLTLIVIDYVQLITPRLYQLVVNGINEGMVYHEGETVPFDMDFLLDEICMPMLIIIALIAIGRFLWRICFFGSAIKIETDLRRRMFDHCKELSQQYYQVNKVGGLMSLFTNDLETVQECFAWGILMFCDAFFLSALALSKMAGMSGMLTLLSMIPMALLLASGIITSRYMMKKWDTRQEAFSKLSDFSQESFAGISVIKAFVKEGKELLAFKNINKENEDANVDYTKLSVALKISVTLLVESVICVILGYGGYLVYCGVFNAGQLVEFIGYFTSIVWPIMAVSELIEMTSRGKASLKRISELLDAKIDVEDAPDATDAGELTGNIEFKDLTFRYPGGEYDVLKNASFEIKAGENVGIIGRTGAGKTTVVDLILRTYNVPDGKIFLDGKDINSLTIKSVRKNAAYVPQDNFLFSDTIENNISFATDGGSGGDVKDAAELSDVHDNIVEFTDGYSTVLGERGVTVSGGQKQRISIARALMKNAPILILDDSVSAVDVKTEKKILANLKRVRAGKTTILIAHRVTTIENMDKIIFIDDGRIVDVGTHTELLERCSSYKTTVELQRLDDAGSGANETGEAVSVNA